MSGVESFKQPLGLRLTTGVFLGIWIVLALFPIVWMAAMSIKTPIDAFSTNPLRVLFGPATSAAVGGWSLLQIGIFAALAFAGWRQFGMRLRRVAAQLAGDDDGVLRWLGMMTLAVAVTLVAIVWVLPPIGQVVTWLGKALGLPALLVEPVVGFTWQHYHTVWVTDGFYQQFINSMIVTLGVVTISLSLGTPAAYAFARTPGRLAMGLLITALVFRAMPHAVLVAGYLPAFINSRETLEPLWTSGITGPFLRLFSEHAPTLYGKTWAIIAVLVAINQPFTIWLLRSYFMSIPHELDEAAMVDGCSPFGAFRRVIMPVMWPGVITTGLFSFLLAYNDYLVASLLLDAASQTMVPTISQYMNSETNLTDQLRAIAAAVSILAPLFVLVLVFQRQLVSGMTAGAVKG